MNTEGLCSRKGAARVRPFSDDRRVRQTGAHTLDPVQAFVAKPVAACTPPPVNKWDAFRFAAMGIALMLTLVACGGSIKHLSAESNSTSAAEDPSSVSSADLSSGANSAMATYQEAVLPSLDSILTTSHDLAAAAQQGDATQVSLDCDSDQSDAEAILTQQQTVGVAPDPKVADDIKEALADFAKAGQVCDDRIDSGVINNLNDGDQHIESARTRMLKLSGIPDSSGG